MYCILFFTQWILTTWHLLRHASPAVAFFCLQLRPTLLWSINIALFSASHVRQLKNMSLDGSQLYDDTIASQDSDAFNSLNSTTPISNTGTKSRIVPKIRALSFRMTDKADLSNGARSPPARAHIWPHGTRKATLCHIADRFYDASRLSGEPYIEGFDSIELHWYVQTNNRMKNHGRKAQKNTRKVGCHKPSL